MGLSFNPSRFNLPRRATVSLLVDNPLGAADLILHGEGALRGWGGYAPTDQTLLYVHGFNPASRQYTYLVNGNFGSTRQLGLFGRPVAATLAVRVDIGPSRERQTLTELLDRGRSDAGPRATEEMLKATFGGGGIINPVAQLLRDGERIHLNGAQADSLASMNLAFTSALDSVWTAFARYAAGVAVKYDQGLVYAHYRQARVASVDFLVAIVPRIKRVLTAEQERQLSPAVASFLDTRYLAGIRAGSEGNSAAGPFGTAAWATAGRGGSGMRTDVIRITP